MQRSCTRRVRSSAKLRWKAPGGPTFDQCRALLAKTSQAMLDPSEIDRLQLEGRSLSIDMAMAEASLV